MKKVRFGVIGTGSIGQEHCAYLHDRLDLAELTAVCDIIPSVAQEVGERYAIPHYTEHTDLLDSGLVDAVLIATPHFFHPPIAIDAFQRGLHVLSETPIGVSIKAAKLMIEAAEQSGKLFGVMYQHRAEPFDQAAIQLLADGFLGDLLRATYTMGCYCGQSYYDSADWRGTWAGEGGGVLINQAILGIDRFTRLVGLPKAVTAHVRTCFHTIEVEDEAFALLKFPNGAHGYLYVSSSECPDSEHMRIAGDRGTVSLDESGGHFWEIRPPLKEAIVSANARGAGPEVKQVEVPTPEGETGQIAITRNFCRAILYEEALLSPGSDGLIGIELANAILLSAHRMKTVELPVDEDDYEDLLNDLRDRSRPKESVHELRVTDLRNER